MVYLLKTNRSYQCLPCHIRTEWNLEINEDTIRAVIERDFEVTLDIASGGEYAIPVSTPPVNKEGYVREHIIPPELHTSASTCATMASSSLKDT